MNIAEASKISKEIKVKGPEGDFYLDLSTGDYCHIPIAYLSLNNWEPVLPEKKTVKKKLYQAIIHNEINNIYSIPVTVFETPEQAEKYASNCSSTVKLIRFLSENPIEVEIEETK